MARLLCARPVELRDHAAHVFRRSAVGDVERDDDEWGKGEFLPVVRRRTAQPPTRATGTTTDEPVLPTRTELPRVAVGVEHDARARHLRPPIDLVADLRAAGLRRSRPRQERNTGAALAKAGRALILGRLSRRRVQRPGLRPEVAGGGGAVVSAWPPAPTTRCLFIPVIDAQARACRDLPVAHVHPTDSHVFDLHAATVARAMTRRRRTTVLADRRCSGRSLPGRATPRRSGRPRCN